MNKKIAIIIVMIILSACRAEPLSPSSTVVDSSVLPTVTESLSTYTPLPTLTPKPSKTATVVPVMITASFEPLDALSLTMTPTFDVTEVVTATPAVLAICPEDNHLVDIPDLQGMSNKNFEATVLDLLNRGAVKELLIERGCRYLEVCREEQVASIDVTGDDVPELIIGGGFPLGNVFVFGCKDGQYVMLLKEKASFDKTPEIIEIADINANGMNDIVVKQITCHVCVGVKVFEWNTEQFSSLVWAELYPGSGEYQDMAEIDGYATVYIEDRDGDGIKEIVLEGGIPSWPGGMWGMDGPYRSKKIVYTWNGENYVFVVQEYEPPRFRFEAVQDGDTASERDDYEKALAFYQAVIYSDTLKSWTYDEWYGTFTDAEYECCSTPDINEMPYNETEYFQLATYSRYRIMVLYVLMGRESDAQTIYKSLLSEVSSDSAGYPYVQLATEFWEEYQESREVLKACEKAIVFAEQNDEILIPLGNNHGMFSKYYKPETICPFK